MTNNMKITKRIDEQLRDIRALVRELPAGKRNSVLNKCDKIAVIATKVESLVRGRIEEQQGDLFAEQHAGNIETNSDIIAHYNAKQAVFEAMCRGRRVSLEDEDEFRTREMHTTICYIRKDIERKGLPWILCDREIRPDPSRRGYKQWWLIPKPEEQEGAV